MIDRTKLLLTYDELLIMLYLLDAACNTPYNGLELSRVRMFLRPRSPINLNMLFAIVCCH